MRTKRSDIWNIVERLRKTNRLMKQLLEKVPHDHETTIDFNSGSRIDLQRCQPDCLACAWQKLKSQ